MKSSFFDEHGNQFYPLPDNVLLHTLEKIPIIEIDFGEGEIGFEPAGEGQIPDYWLVIAKDTKNKLIKAAELKTKDLAESFISRKQISSANQVYSKIKSKDQDNHNSFKKKF